MMMTGAEWVHAKLQQLRQREGRQFVIKDRNEKLTTDMLIAVVGPLVEEVRELRAKVNRQGATEGGEGE